MTENLHFPTPDEHDRMIESPDARALRRSERLGQYATHEAITKRGRKQRVPVNLEGQLSLYPTVITADTVDDLAALLPKDRPMLDEFSYGYYVRPLTSERLRAYVVGGYAGRKTLEEEQATDLSPSQNLFGANAKEDDLSAKHSAEGVSTREDEMHAKLRRSHHIADLLQQASYAHQNVARLRASSLKTVLTQVETQREVDSFAGIHAADAVQDFGFTLQYKKSTTAATIRAALRNENIGYVIVTIGLAAEKDPASLLQNIQLAEVVLGQQRIRYRFWMDTLVALSLIHI